MKIHNIAVSFVAASVLHTASAGECTDPMMEAWLAENTMLKQDLDAVMLFPQYQLAAEACADEIQAYNDATEVSCKKNKELGIWNYGDYWVMTVWPSMAMNQPSTNGAPYNDGAYDLATMFGGSANFTVLEPGNLPTLEQFESFCLSDCYLGGPGCEWIMDVVPPPEFGIPDLFIKDGMPKITVEQYCASGIHEADVAFMNMKVCAAKAISATPVNGMTTEEMLAAIEAHAANSMSCSLARCAESTTTESEASDVPTDAPVSETDVASDFEEEGMDGEITGLGDISGGSIAVATTAAAILAAVVAIW